MQKTNRLDYLDYLRGYFVVVIITDHLWRYPSLFSLITGEARLWMTAAEGFVMISGFLIGYVRGFKGRKKPFTATARKLLQRAAVLYGAMVIMSLVYISIEWSDVVRSMPYTPMPDAIRSWPVAIWQVMTLQTPHTWVHFLALYTLFLLLAIPAVWLLRHRKAWVVALLSLALYGIGLYTKSEWLSWQILFLLPAIAGFYFEDIRAWWRQRDPLTRHRLITALLIYVLPSLTISVLCAYFPQVLSPFGVTVFESPFLQANMWPLRMINAFAWFIALVLLFRQITPWLKRWTYGILGYIGTHSLQAYIAHGFVICFFSLFIPDSSSWFINTIYGFVAILMVYAIICAPILRKLIPR